MQALSQLSGLGQTIKCVNLFLVLYCTFLHMCVSIGMKHGCKVSHFIKKKMLGSFAGTQSNEVETQHTSAYASIRQHYISIRQLYDRAPSAPASRATFFGLAVIAFANER
jgi:hypothetical protein